MARDPFTPELPDDEFDDDGDRTAHDVSPGAPDVRQAVAAGRRKGGAAGAVLAGAMVAMRDLLEKPKDEIPIEVEASGEPHDVDRDGFRLELDGVDVSAPPLEPKAPLQRAKRRRRR